MTLFRILALNVRDIIGRVSLSRKQKARKNRYGRECYAVTRLTASLR